MKNQKRKICFVITSFIHYSRNLLILEELEKRDNVDLHIIVGNNISYYHSKREVFYMKIVIFTSNATRHKFVANILTKHADDVLVVVECKPSDALVQKRKMSDVFSRHFEDRYLTEAKLFDNNEVFIAKTFPLVHGEINLASTCEVVHKFNPDMAFVFGSSIIKEPLLSLIPKGRFVNMHLGVSPYYRGSGTNFWPFINNELECIGATLLHIDAGIDTGDVIGHIRPKIELGDTVHSLGCKTIEAGADGLVRCLKLVKCGQVLQRFKQWNVPNARYYRKGDFSEAALKEYLQKLDNGLVEKYLKSKKSHPRLIDLY